MMELSATRLRYLWERYLDRSATQSELKELTDWLASEKNSEPFQQTLEPLLSNTAVDVEELASHREYVLRKVRERMTEEDEAALRYIPDHSPRRRNLWIKWVAAAAVITIAFTFFWPKKAAKDDQQTTIHTVANDVAPGGNKAILKLADGSTITLDSAANGKLASQNGVDVIKTTEGAINYQAGNASIRLLAYNTLMTPKGGQFQLTLPDGSKVWLNAASSITYPVAFTGNDRSVSITGEAYFEVTKDKTKPFVVSAGQQQVEVLGTSFNVNAYEDEAGKVSLLEGSVQILREAQSNKPVILQPGQAYTDNKVVASNIEQDVAWKNGIFNFNGADLPAVMRQLERWYDIQVVYRNSNMKQRIFKGELPRDMNISEVLLVLQDMKINYKLENRTLYIE